MSFRRAIPGLALVSLVACGNPVTNYPAQLTVQVFAHEAQATPTGAVTVQGRSRLAITVSPAAGYSLSSAVAGTCPAGAWAGHVYTTGLIVADCAVDFSASLNTFQVTPSGDGNESTTPTGPQTVSDGATQSFTVTANAGYTVSTAVTGTCPAGTWSGSAYTTGAIEGDCSVVFSATLNTYQVSAAGDGNETISPTGPQTITYGQPASFTVTANTGYTVATAVGGTCPAGAWTGSVYATGAIAASCSVMLAATVNTYQVSAVGDGNETITPTGPQTIAYGQPASFTVVANTGYTLATSVGGTCPPGTWSGTTYAIASITGACGVVFGATLTPLQVAAVGDGNEMIAPTGSQTITYGSSASFTVTPAASDLLAPAVGGTCPAGMWSGATYITGAITASCDVTFNAGPIVLEPGASQMLSVVYPTQTPTLSLLATLLGAPLDVTWSVDRTNVATIAAGPSSTALLTPTGSSGGLVTVTASVSGVTATVQVLMTLTIGQNGANDSPAEAAQLVSGTNAGVLQTGGGINGVGGEGLGPAVANFPTTVMPPSAMGLTFVYPYNNTVWPLGLPAPQLMWNWTPNNADAIQIQLTDASQTFSYTGTFGPPAILASSGGAFIRHPVPQDIWDLVTRLAAFPQAGTAPDPVTLTLTVAHGGIAYGPITETWTIAPADLTGTIYYTAYGTHFVKNWVDPDAVGNPIGAAVLGVHPGMTAPTLIAGQNSPLGGNGIPTNDTGCRACHTVSSGGRWLVTQAEQGTPGDGTSYLYDLSESSPPTTAATLSQQGFFGWLAMLSDGSFGLTDVVNPSSSNPMVSSAQSTFWQFLPTIPPSGMQATTMPSQATLAGLPAGLSAGYPTFSPDNSRVTYLNAGANTGDIIGEPIVAAAYDTSTQAFSNVSTVVPGGSTRQGFPTFLPDASGVLYEVQVRKACGDTVMVTRNGARSALSWANVGGSPSSVTLSALNGTVDGVSYLPTNANDHGAGPSKTDLESSCYASEAGYDDTTLNYDPSVLPIVAGGYAWVVFTSRRLYGNQLTELPWLSWPPDYNTQSLSQATVKKLWVAAINLNGQPGADISHPAFYLPGQEILSANGHGRWAFDPCHADGASCLTGDECCNGYCGSATDGGAPICASAATSGCSQPQEKCASASDCCESGDTCVNSFCASPAP